MRFALALVVLAALACGQQSIVDTAAAIPSLSTLVSILTTPAYVQVLSTLNGTDGPLFFLPPFPFSFSSFNALSLISPSLASLIPGDFYIEIS